MSSGSPVEPVPAVIGAERHARPADGVPDAHTRRPSLPTVDPPMNMTFVCCVPGTEQFVRVACREP